MVTNLCIKSHETFWGFIYCMWYNKHHLVIQLTPTLPLFELQLTHCYQNSTAQVNRIRVAMVAAEFTCDWPVSCSEPLTGWLTAAWCFIDSEKMICCFFPLVQCNRWLICSACVIVTQPVFVCLFVVKAKICCLWQIHTWLEWKSTNGWITKKSTFQRASNLFVSK